MGPSRSTWGRRRPQQPGQLPDSGQSGEERSREADATHTFSVRRVEQPQVAVQVWQWQVESVPVEAPFLREAEEGAVRFMKGLGFKHLLKELGND